MASENDFGGDGVFADGAQQQTMTKMKEKTVIEGGLFGNADMKDEVKDSHAGASRVLGLFDDPDDQAELEQ